MLIKDKVAVITGGGSGMGEACAHHLAGHGAKIAILDFNLENAEKVAKSVEGYAVQCDVADDAAVQSAVADVVKHFAAIHININCAGVATAGRVVGKEGPMALSDFQRTIEVNLIGTFNVLRCCAAQMVKQEPLNDDGERGVAINTASVAAFDGQLGQAAYSASKGGVVSMALPIAREMSKFGVRVMTIAPGVIATPMMGSMPDKVKQSLEETVPFPKRLGAPEEFAAVAQQIIENAYLNASVIRLDAGLRMS
ncbi:MAG: SDR family NAD(P)-dependent oxidoreductase [Gammaproteobacteria bacterium]|nr:SDR family NAD(P)-dependent oxidoreductase [Gammaproteobacteria bacterium]MCH9744260.1 SDR family NAD(P)-dependent oxidoreductase [Gammaproteobacteria bacterium]